MSSGDARWSAASFGHPVCSTAPALDGAALDMLAGFVRLCHDGWRLGWHERNGGNLSCRLSDEEARALLADGVAVDAPWVDAGFAADPVLGGHLFAVTGSGKFMRNVADDPCTNVGVVQMAPDGDRWRVVWGLVDGTRPTSELATHLMCHAAIMRSSAGEGRASVLYHAHVPHLDAMTFVLPLEDRAFSRALWKVLTESAIVFPEGAGVIPWMPPGSEALARASAGKMASGARILVWAHHGAFCAGASFDETFGLMHTAEKAAGIYLEARCANGGSGAFASAISDAELRELARMFNLTINEAFLD